MLKLEGYFGYLGMGLAAGFVLLAAIIGADALLRGTDTAGDVYRTWREDGARAIREASVEDDVMVRNDAEEDVEPVPPKKPVRSTATAGAASAVRTSAGVSRVVVSFNAVGTYWRGSFMPLDTIDEHMIPAMRVLVQNTGTAASAAWTLTCSFDGMMVHTRGYQAPLRAGERAYAVCDTDTLSPGTYVVSATYEENGKSSQTVTGTLRVR